MTSAGGLLSMGFNQLLGLIVQLYLVSIGTAPFWIGVILSARSALSLLYSIHLGRVIDLVGARRAILVFSGLGAALALLYPLFVHVGVLIFLQLLCGMVAATCWMGSQAAIALMAKDEPGVMAPFSFFSTAGNFLAPLLTGYIWDVGGAWPAFIFSSFWLLCLLAAAYGMPREQPLRREAPLGIAIMVPQWEGYSAACRLLRVPAVRFIMTLTFLRLAGVVMLESFYAVLLGQKGYAAGTIGLLMGFGWLVSTPSALLTPFMVRLLRSENRVILFSTFLSLFAMAATPAFDSVVLLAILAAIFGAGQGISFSLFITGASRSFPPDQLGLSVGLRSTINRVAGLVTPLVMGATAQWIGVSAAFWMTGLVLIAVLIVVGWSHRRQ